MCSSNFHQILTVSGTGTRLWSTQVAASNSLRDEDERLLLRQGLYRLSLNGIYMFVKLNENACKRLAMYIFIGVHSSVHSLCAILSRHKGVMKSSYRDPLPQTLFSFFFYLLFESFSVGPRIFQQPCMCVYVYVRVSVCVRACLTVCVGG